MTSRILSLLSMLGPRGITTVNNPNSWAVVSLWRVFFQYSQEEKERQMVEAQEILCLLLGISVETIRPAAADSARRERLAFARAGHRNTMNTSPSSMQQRETQHVMTPNLDIPHDDEYLYLPQ